MFKFVGLILLFTLMATEALAGPLSLDSFLERIQSKHPFFKKEELATDIQAKEQEAHLGDQDWVISGSPSVSHSENSRTMGFLPEKENTARLNLSAKRLFWGSGASLSFNYGYNYTDQQVESQPSPAGNGPAGIPQGQGGFPSELIGVGGEFHESFASVTYRHPLIRNSGGTLSRLTFDVQGHNVEVSKITATENQEDFLLDVSGVYIDWAMLTEQKRIAENRLALAKEEEERTKEKRKHNLVDEVDVIRAADAVIASEQNVKLIESVQKGLEVELKTIASIPAEEDIAPDIDLYSSKTMILSLSSALRVMDDSSRLLKVFDIRAEQLERQRQGAIETKRANLDAVLKAGVKGGDEELGQAFAMDKPQASAALMFSFPLGYSRANADIAKVELQRKKLDEEKESVRLKLHAAIGALLERMKLMEEALAMDRKRVRTAEEKTLAEFKRYEQGRVELTFVIQSRDSEQAARLAYARNAADYHRLVIAYKALLDQLLQTP